MADSALSNLKVGYKMTQASVIKQQDPTKISSKDSYIDRRAHMFESYAQRYAQGHSFLSGEDALKLAQGSAEVKSNKEGSGFLTGSLRTLKD